MRQSRLHAEAVANDVGNAVAESSPLINAKWHNQHVMPMGSTLSQRVDWHVAHAKACGCREIPPTVLKELRRRGKKIPKRRGHAA